MHFESERLFNSYENCLLFLTRCLVSSQDNSFSFPSQKVNSIQWPTSRSARDYMQTCAIILKFYIILCIYILITSFFKNPATKIVTLIVEVNWMQ